MTDGPAHRLAFSTLACPEWDAETVVQRAGAYGFDAVEWRGGPDGTVRTAWTQQRRAAVHERLAAAGVASLAVTAYSNLISGDATVRIASVDEIVAHAELASDLGARVVRVFLGVRDDDAPSQELTERAVDALVDALARTSGAIVLAIEPHDEHVRADRLAPILDALPDRRLAVVWDIANAWAAGEAPDVGLAAYAGRIAYVQVKDGTGRGRAWRLCAVGAGEVPLGSALTALAERGRVGGAPLPPLSVEWERAWHPDLAPPDVALPAARAWLSARLGTQSDQPADLARGPR